MCFKGKPVYRPSLFTSPPGAQCVSRKDSDPIKWDKIAENDAAGVAACGSS